jgi:hypothetical protein
MAAVADMLGDVRKDIDKMNHSRNAYSISHPIPIAGSLSSHTGSTTGCFEQTNTPTLEPDLVIEEDLVSADRPHTGTSTCCCTDCVLPGDLTFDEYERHLTTKIDTGRRELEGIEGQLTRCYNLMKTLNELEKYAVQLQADNEDDRINKRQTFCGLPSLSTLQPQQRNTPGSSFNSAVPSSFYSERSSAERESGSPDRNPPFSVPARASSSQQSRASRLSKPFSGSRGIFKSTESYAVGSGDDFDSVVKPLPSRSRHAEEHQHSNSFAYSELDKALPVLRHAYTPRTQSTADLLGSLSWADFLAPTNMPYESSIFNRRGGFVAVDTSDDYLQESSGTSTPQHTFKWHAQRMGGMRLMPRRRHSKADELLGFVTPEPGSRPTSSLSLRDTYGPSEGKKSKMSLLKFSKLRKAKGEN